MAKVSITPRAQNFPRWYQDVLAAAPDLYDESPVTGCITFGPLATKLWQKVRECMDERLRALGVENIMLPTLIPESFFAREKEHVEGFAPEVAIVTHAGGEKLAQPYFIRPTSELLFVDWYVRGGRVQSHRDLPLLVNQWCSVMRWEKRPRAFLRTTEFHWQEGHCLFADEASCRDFTLKILDLYAEVATDLLAIPVVKGDKPHHERFPGAIGTYTIEGMMQDGKALQMGTSHMLSQNFLMDSDGKARVSFLDEKEQKQIPFYDSWGVSTRLIGALFMTHGDDDGIVLPPRVAPVHATVLPIFGSKDSENSEVLKTAQDLAKAIAGAPNPFDLQVTSCSSDRVIRAGKLQASNMYSLHGRPHWFSEINGPLTVRIDERPDVRLGEKTFHQIRSGTPVRIEIGERDLADGSCVIKSRIRGRDAAVKAALADAPAIVSTMLKEDQDELVKRALALRKNRTVEAQSYDELKEALKDGKWAHVAWDGTQSTVDKLKADTSGGTYRCFAFDAPEDAKKLKDPVSGKPSAFSKRVIVGKAY